MKCQRSSRTARIAFAIAILAVTTAHATNSGSQTPIYASVSPTAASGSLAASQSKSAAKSRSASQASSTSGASSNSQGGRSESKADGGSASSDASIGQIATTLSSADAQNVSVTGDHVEAPRIPVASAIATVGETTAACHYSTGGAGQSTFLGLSLSFNRKDKDCERYAVANAMYARGYILAGDKLMCRIGVVREALGSDCLELIATMREPPKPDIRLEKKREFERGVGK